MRTANGVVLLLRYPAKEKVDPGIPRAFRRYFDQMTVILAAVVLEEAGKFRVMAAGPTTSIREEPYQWQIIRDFGLRGVIGKGGMEGKTLKACQDHGCVYFHAVGGAAQVLAECVRKVRNVHLLEQFGAPEAIWELEVERFPVVVTMDSHGVSLHDAIYQSSQKALASRL